MPKRDVKREQEDAREAKQDIRQAMKHGSNKDVREAKDDQREEKQDLKKANKRDETAIVLIVWRLPACGSNHQDAIWGTAIPGRIDMSSAGERAWCRAVLSGGPRSGVRTMTTTPAHRFIVGTDVDDLL